MDGQEAPVPDLSPLVLSGPACWGETEGVLGAPLLPAARRTVRSGPPLPPVRTLHYFLPSSKRSSSSTPDPGYAEYLAAKLVAFASKKTALLGER